MFKQFHSREQHTSILAGKRVIIVLPGLKMGGAERQALLLARHLVSDQKAAVQVWGLNHAGQAARLCDAYGLPWRVVKMTWSYDRIMRFKAWARFAWTLRQAQPDVILTYSMRPNVVCGLIWRWTGAQLCIWNQRDEGRSDRVGGLFQQSAARLVPLFISNSHHGKDFLCRSLAVNPNRIHVIKNGVELLRPKVDHAAWRSQPGVSEDCFLACMVANLHIYKDHATLVRAWRQVVDRLREKDESALLLLAGRFGDTYKYLQALVHELKLAESVRFLGSVDDIPDLLNAVDLGILSSQYEGCPNGILECMAAGLPIVGSDIPGIREALGPKGYSCLAPPGDAEALADRILELLTKPELRRKLGTLNRHRIEVEFSPQHMCEKTVALITDNLEAAYS